VNGYYSLEGNSMKTDWVCVLGCSS